MQVLCVLIIFILGSNNIISILSDCQPSTSKPIHIRRVEQALNLNPFLRSFNKSALSSDSESSDDNGNNDFEGIDNLLKDEPHSAKDYYNFKNVSLSRKWLTNVLSENIDTGPEDAPYKYLLKMHAFQKKMRKMKMVCFSINLNKFLCIPVVSEF